MLDKVTAAPVVEETENRHEYLRIKVLSLAVEAALIREVEGRYLRGSPTRMGLRAHRVREVRQEARAAQLARGFLKMVFAIDPAKKAKATYRSMEAKTHEPPNWARVWTLIDRYGLPLKAGKNARADLKARFEAWQRGE